MKKNNISIILTLFTLLLLPMLAFAAPEEGGLVPQWCQVGCPCSLCDLFDLADNIIGFLLYMIAVPIAAGAFLYGGVLMLTSGGDPSQITKGRGVMTSAVIGMTLAFFAWAIFNTVLTTIGFGIDGASWYEIPDCDKGGADTCNATLKFKQPPPPLLGPDPTDHGAILSHDEAYNLLMENGIRIAATGNCYRNEPTCTYLGGLSLETIGQIVIIDDSCDGCITVTGGTEPGHATHGADFPTTVDLDYNQGTLTALQDNGIPTDANFGRGATCELNRQKVNCGSSPKPDHIHVEF